MAIKSVTRHHGQSKVETLTSMLETVGGLRVLSCYPSQSMKNSVSFHSRLKNNKNKNPGMYHMTHTGNMLPYESFHEIHLTNCKSLASHRLGPVWWFFLTEPPGTPAPSSTLLPPSYRWPLSSWSQMSASTLQVEKGSKKRGRGPCPLRPRRVPWSCHRNLAVVSHMATSSCRRCWEIESSSGLATSFAVPSVKWKCGALFRKSGKKVLKLNIKLFPFSVGFLLTFMMVFVFVI